DLDVKLAGYRHCALTGRCPSAEEVSESVHIDVNQVVDAFRDLRGQRVLLLEPDCESIRMAPPFSGVPTQHVVISGGVSYFANCAWDALGVPAALRQPATVHSRCEQSLEPLNLTVGPLGPEGPEASAGWLFHCGVPAAHWWDDL